MRPLFWAATTFALVVGAAPCFAESKLAAPIEAIDDPIALQYGEISDVPYRAEVSISYYKDEEKVRSVEERFDGVFDVHPAGGNLEVSIVGYSNVSVTDESHSKSRSEGTCLMRTTGEQLECEGKGKVTYPLLDRPGYKTGDTMIFPFGTLNGDEWPVSGKVVGKSQFGQRPVLVVEFAGSRTDRMGSSEIKSEMTSFAYLDLTVGYPLYMEATAEFRGLFRDYDRMQLVMRLDCAIPAQQ